MKKTGIFYGSSTGTCQEIAKSIAKKLGISNNDVIDIANANASQIESYDNLLLGTSTWGVGDMQDDWYEGINIVKSANLSGKTVALFGCGDSESYCDTFCDGMGEIYNSLKGTGCAFIGQVPADDYSFSSSNAIVGDKFVGLAIDDVNESDKTERRISSWIDAIKGLL